MTNAKTHFELHFQPNSWVLYEELNGSWHRTQYKNIATCGNIKRIHYNSEKWKNYIIVDIDNKNLFEYRKKGLPEPNFILKNKNKVGGHLFYVLDKGIYFKNKYYLEKWQTLQVEYTKIAGGDPLNKGYVGKFVNSKFFEYIELNPFAYNVNYLASKIINFSVNNQAYKPKKHNPYIIATKTNKKPINSFKSPTLVKVGERNNTLFNKTRKYAYIQVLKVNKNTFKQNVFNYALQLNQRFLEPQQESEVKATARSIIKYCLKNKAKIEQYNTEKHIKRGIMDLPPEQALKKKQQLGAEYTAQQKANKTIFKLRLAIIEMKARELKINISSLSKYSKISRPTIRKYKENLEF